MFKSISAALLALSVLAAPALAANSSTTTPAPTTKAAQVKPALNANARIGRHHVRYTKHYRSHHKQIGALKLNKSRHFAKTSRKHFSKVSTKHAGSATKRG